MEAVSDARWRKKLTPKQFHVLREKGTEAAFSGGYHDFKESGMYLCAGCGNELFSSETKYDSGSGWPSFWMPSQKKNIELRCDESHDMSRTEVACSRCLGHLGHVFDDGPQPTGKRFCINSAALQFKSKKD